jgi:transcription antitermination factor NusG
MPLDAVAHRRVATPEPAVGDLGCGSRWGVVHTHPQAEQWASANLRRQGYQVWLLTRAVLRMDRVTRTMTQRIQVPLFTSYLFVDIQSPWTPIAHSRGVNRLMMSGPNPYLLPEGAVSALRGVEALAATPQQRKEARWASGDAVAPRGGPLAGLPGVVLAVEGENATVGILFLGQLREVVYPFDALVERQDY